MQFQLSALLLLAAAFVSAHPAAPVESAPHSLEICFGENALEAPSTPALHKRQFTGKTRLYANGLSVLNSGYTAMVPPVYSTTNTWNKGHGPGICKERALQTRSDGRANCPLDMLRTYELKYSDCSQTWLICRCDDAEMSVQQMRVEFGRIPPKMRSWVHHMIAFQANSCSAGSSEDAISFYGQCASEGPTVFIHETAHSIDQGFSGSQDFRNAVAADTCIPDNYAASALHEDFAQVSVVVMSGKNALSHGGANTSCMQNQYDLVWSRFQGSMSNANPGTCDLAVRGRATRWQRNEVW